MVIIIIGWPICHFKILPLFKILMICIYYSYMMVKPQTIIVTITYFVYLDKISIRKKTNTLYKK